MASYINMECCKDAAAADDDDDDGDFGSSGFVIIGLLRLMASGQNRITLHQYIPSLLVVLVMFSVRMLCHGWQVTRISCTLIR